ncbi:MAG TPA: hypothetical protein P5533_07475 [Candidatus Cloacimonadota bacterium]|nr:hypothetical protein [Candidatus Cloacimonadota bacterium]
MKTLLLLPVLMVLSACVAMDVSNLETAEPLRKGKMRIGINSGIGLDLTAMMESESESLISDEYPGAVISGFQAQYGLTGDLDLGARVWAGGSSTGFKAYLKKTLSQSEEGKSFAITPGFSFVRSEAQYDIETDDYNDWYSAAEGSVQVLLTKRWSKAAAGTISGRAGVAYYDGDSTADRVEVYQDFMVHSGISANIKLSMGPFYLIPELGGEFYTNPKGFSGVVPFYMLGIGFE